jgi:hypothetical protein
MSTAALGSGTAPGAARTPVAKTEMEVKRMVTSIIAVVRGRGNTK